MLTDTFYWTWVINITITQMWNFSKQNYYLYYALPTCCSPYIVVMCWKFDTLQLKKIHPNACDICQMVQNLPLGCTSFEIIESGRDFRDSDLKCLPQMVTIWVNWGYCIYFFQNATWIYNVSSSPQPTKVNPLMFHSYQSFRSSNFKYTDNIT